jgi:hypothetical protein
MVQVKIMVKLSLLHAIKTYWETGSTAPPFLISALDVDELSVSRRGKSRPIERAPGTLKGIS